MIAFSDVHLGWVICARQNDRWLDPLPAAVDDAELVLLLNGDVVDGRSGRGTFPFVDVCEAIDGTPTVRAHGVSEMPVWGDVVESDATSRRSSRPSRAAR